MLLQKKSRAKLKNADLADDKKTPANKDGAKDKKKPQPRKDKNKTRNKLESRSEPKLNQRSNGMNVAIFHQPQPNHPQCVDEANFGPYNPSFASDLYHALPAGPDCLAHGHCSQTPWTSGQCHHASPPMPSMARPQGHFHSMSTSSIPRFPPRTNNFGSPSVGFSCPHGMPGYMNQGAAVFDRLSTKMNEMLYAIDGDEISGDELDFADEYNDTFQASASPPQLSRAVRTTRPARSKPSLVTSCFSKAWMYSNSRLPPHLPPFKVYMPTYPLLTLAARYALTVYQPTSSSSKPQRFHHIPANTRLGTKAMTLTTQTLDARNTIALSIRGSATFADWAVNFRPAPTEPTHFLDDIGNLCHAGFLHVARAMIIPIATHLRSLLDEQAATQAYTRRNITANAPSLLICGHSAGGAVAALLYSHMLSTRPTVSSPLKDLTHCFKRIHCITFGAPPVSLLPLQTPPVPPSGISDGGYHHSSAAAVATAAAAAQSRARKSLFFAFINEGDPVVRAEMSYARSLMRLYAAPLPNHQSDPVAAASSSSSSSSRHEWPVPEATLSCAGRLVLLRNTSRTTSYSGHVKQQQQQQQRTARSKKTFGILGAFKAGGNLDGLGESLDDSSDDDIDADEHERITLGLVGERVRNNPRVGFAPAAKSTAADVQACMTSDEQLRGVVFGDLRVHAMRVYKERIEALAVGAVMGEQ